MTDLAAAVPKTPWSRRDAIVLFHEELIARARSGPVALHEVCGWSSVGSQQARFAALLRASGYRGGTVVDYGCGTGDLYPYLFAQGYPFTYLGLDLSRSMLEIARKSHPGVFQQTTLDALDFPPADYVFASGVFQFADPDDPFYYRRLLRGLVSKSRLAVAVNFLSACRDDSEKREDELYLHPEEVAGLASSLSGRWALDHSYHPGRADMTVGIHMVPGVEAWAHPHVGRRGSDEQS